MQKNQKKLSFGSAFGFVFALAFLIFPLSSKAVITSCSDPSVSWKKTYDGGATDQAYDAATGPNGNVYVAGQSFNGANKDYLLVAYDSNGNFLWKKTYDAGFNNDSGDQAYGVAVDPVTGDVYVTGDSEAGGVGSKYARVVTVKYDSAGNLLGTWTFDVVRGAWRGNFGTGIAIKDNNVYITGGGFNANRNWDYLLLAYDKNGNYLWDKIYDGGGGAEFPDQPDPGGDKASGQIAIDGAGNIFMTGYAYNGSNNDFWTIKTDGAGNLLANIKYDSGTAKGDFAWGIGLDSGGNVYVSGIVDASSEWSRGYALLIKYNNSLGFDWRRFASTPYDDWFYRLDMDGSDRIYASGGVWNPLNGSYDFLVTKWDVNGNLIWLKSFEGGNGGNENIASRGIAVDGNGNVFATGYAAAGSIDYITIKYAKPCGGAFNFNFTDSALTPGVTPIRKVHYEDLRCAINGLRENAEIGWYNFFEGVTAGATPIKASQISSFRARLNEVYSACGQPAQTFTDSGLTSQSPIRAVHFEELRNAVKNAP